MESSVAAGRKVQTKGTDEAPSVRCTMRPFPYPKDNALVSYCLAGLDDGLHTKLRTPYIPFKNIPRIEIIEGRPPFPHQTPY